jgi:hypothetical protein
MEDVMQHSTKFRKIRWVALVALALLVVPVAQAKPITMPKQAQAGQGETAQGLAADALRWNAIANAYKATTGAYLKAATFKASQSAEQLVLDANPIGIQKHYPFANENTAAFVAAEQKASLSAPISENSPVELRLHPSTPVTVLSTSTSFNWRDAGIGAGLAALLTSMLMLGASTMLTRKPVAHV